MNEEKKNLSVVLPTIKVWSCGSGELRNLKLLRAKNSEKQRIQGDFFVEGNPSGGIAINILPPTEELRKSLVYESNFTMSMWRFEYWYFMDNNRAKLIACSDIDSCHFVYGDFPGLFAYEWLYRVYLTYLGNHDPKKFDLVKDEILLFYETKLLSDILPVVQPKDPEFQNFIDENEWDFVANIKRG